jgi:hypothetical protein
MFLMACKMQEVGAGLEDGLFMGTVLLLGSRGPTLTSLSGLLKTLECRVLHADAPGQHGRSVNLTLAVIEFRPQDTPLAAFTRRLHLLAPLPTLVVGPDLAESQVERLLALPHVGSYLKINAPASEKRAALRAWLPELPRAVLSLGQLHLNVEDQSVRYGTQPLTFTLTEYRLLRVLMGRPGQRTDCATLAALARCRGVPAHLGNVRRKLAGWSAVPLLRGNPTQGYALDARRHPRALPDPGLALRTHLRQLF